MQGKAIKLIQRLIFLGWCRSTIKQQLIFLKAKMNLQRSKKVKSSFEPDQTLTTRKRRLNDATLQSHSCVTCGATFQSSDDLLDHLSGSEQQDGSGSTMSRCSIRHCFMCGFVPAPDVCLDDRRRCLQDHIITEHFKVHIHQFTLALQ